MDLELQGLTWKTCLVYLDDVIVIGKTFKDHLEKLKEVLTIIHGAQLKLSPKKCSLFQKEVQYLGHLVSAAGVSMDPKKVDTVRDWPVPKNKHEVRSLLGLCSYYRRFVKSFATIAKPLHELTENKRNFQWSRECEQAFRTLKICLLYTSRCV